MAETPTHEELTPEQEQEQYDALFAAQARGEELPADEDDDEDRASESSDNSPDDKDQTEDDDESSEDGKAGKLKEGTSGTQDDEYSWFEKLPQDVREQAEALRHKHMSNTGRVAALTRRLNNVQAQLDAVAAKSSKPDSRPTKPTSKPEDSEESLSPELKELTEKFPTLRKAVDQLVSRERKQLEAEFLQEVEPLKAELTTNKQRERRNRLSEGASEIFDTPNTGVDYMEVIESDFYKNEFLANQPEEFRRIAMTTNDVDTALWVLRQFRTFADQYAEENELVERLSPATNKADRATERRAARKSTSGTVPSRSAMADPEEGLSYDDMFARMHKPKKRAR